MLYYCHDRNLDRDTERPTKTFLPKMLISYINKNKKRNAPDSVMLISTPGEYRGSRWCDSIQGHQYNRKVMMTSCKQHSTIHALGLSASDKAYRNWFDTNIMHKERTIM